LFLPVAIPDPPKPAPDDSPEVAELKRQLHWAYLKIQVLEERLRWQRIQKYGPASEKLSDAQLELLEREPGVSHLEVRSESAREPLPPGLGGAPRARGQRPHPGRQELPADLPHVERVIACAAEQCQCSHCGQLKTVIGYETSEQLDVEPAKYFVLVTKREKRACRQCEQGGVTAAPAPARIIEKGLVSDRIVIDTVISKYSDHLPLYRQSVMLERETGLEINRATLDGWVMTVGGLLIPVAATMGRELVTGPYIQADETPVDVQMHDRRGKNHQAYLWQYSRPGGSVVFDFQLGRGRDGPKKFLAGFNGILQTDGYAAYDKVGGPKLVHAACWSHSRRKFYEAHQVSPGESVAQGIVLLIDDLFRIDAEARAQNLDWAARDQLRQQQARPLLDVIRQQIEAAREQVLPASKLGGAIAYTLGLWERLKRFLDYPELELSTNLAENSMRGVALGRKNWIHIGSPLAGPKVAAILSVVETCRRLDIPARGYLGAVLPGLAGVSIQKLAQLTPAAWAARNR
jgi:transposase